MGRVTSLVFRSGVIHRGSVDKHEPQRLAPGVDVLVFHAFRDEHEAVFGKGNSCPVCGHDVPVAAHDEVDFFGFGMVVQ
jgi:ribosomal protein S27AE